MAKCLTVTKMDSPVEHAPRHDVFVESVQGKMVDIIDPRESKFVLTCRSNAILRKLQTLVYLLVNWIQGATEKRLKFMDFEVAIDSTNTIWLTWVNVW